MLTKDQWRWYLEFVTGLAVVMSLVVLIVEVRTNTAAVERQGRIDQLNMLIQPFLDDVEMGVVLAKIKAVDGREPLVSALMNTYELTEVEAAAWNRSLFGFWKSIEADYIYSGPDAVEEIVRAMIEYPDAKLYWQNNHKFHLEEFARYVDRVRTQLDSED